MREKTKWTNIAKRKFSVSVIGISLLIGSCLVLSEVTSAKNGLIVTSEDQTEIQSIIREVIQGEAQKKIKTKEESIKEAEELLKQYATNLDSMIKGILETGIETGDIPIIVGCNSNLTFGEIEISQRNKVTIKVTEDRVCEYETGPPEEGIYTHLFILSKKGKKWEIKNFEDGSEVKGEPLTSEVRKLLPVPSTEEAIKDQKIEE